MKLDIIDYKILKELQDDARKPFSRIASDLGVSNTQVHQRINKMKTLGVIEKFEVKLNASVLGYETIAFMGIILKDTSRTKNVVDYLETRIEEIVECSYISGQYTLFVKIRVRNNHHLREVFEKLDSNSDILRTETFISFDLEFQKSMPLDKNFFVSGDDTSI